ncbi:hypothetical protein EHS25_002002 [Saitozyma podzolica]|uniref:Uncharacterized protein n=1 Tax=Saitozyma podzolica TaxID=1890683 RepID=A0A427YEK0_9TREE|nr:hypothetical protein EHS25_002002 [Saitozyma podzolica]
MASNMVPQEELPVLESLIQIRNRLTALKKDTTKFVRTQDVMSIYNAVVKQVTRLNAIRDEQSQAQSSLATNAASSSNTPNSGPAPPEPNRVDTVLGDVFALLSLFFLTIGKSRETPAIYCQIASMRQILSHMNESGAYTEAFLLPYRERLESLKQILRQDSAEGKHPEPIVRLMMRKLEGVGEYPERTSHLSRQWANRFAERQLNELFSSLSVISVELVPIHKKLVGLRKQLALMSAEPKPNKQEYKAIMEDLRKIDGWVRSQPRRIKRDSGFARFLSTSADDGRKRVDGKFLGPGGSSVPEGQALLSGLLDTCFDVAQDIKAREAEEDVSPTLKPIYDRLNDMKNQLEQLSECLLEDADQVSSGIDRLGRKTRADAD